MERFVAGNGVTMVGACEGSVRFGFTERAGGVSRGPYASLNLGSHVGDDPAAVGENRARACAALGAGDLAGRLLVPNQVHGDRVVTVAAADVATEDGLAAVRADIASGCDAIVCTAPGTPVALCFADCVPVVLTCAGGFAIAHSGWRGTLAGIAGKAATALCAATGAAPGDVRAYIGPHILGDEYEVSQELVDRFTERFGRGVATGRMLDLSCCIRASLAGAGVPADAVCDPQLSTVRLNGRFYSYRAESGTCGRHAAVGVLP